MLKSLKTAVNTLKNSVSRLHSVNMWKTFSDKLQKGHTLTTVGFMTDKNALVAMAPCKIRHWRSAVRFFKGAL